MRAARHVARRVLTTTLLVMAVCAGVLALSDLVERGGVEPWRAVLVWRDQAPMFLAVGAVLCLTRLRQRGELLALSVAGVGRGALMAGVAAPMLALGLVLGGLAEVAAPTALDRIASSDEVQLAGAWAKTADGFVNLDHGLHVSVEDGALVRSEWTPVVETSWWRHPSERGAAELDGSWFWHRVLAPLTASLTALGLAGLALRTRQGPAVATMGAAVLAGVVMLSSLVAAPSLGGVGLALGLLACLGWTGRQSTST